MRSKSRQAAEEISQTLLINRKLGKVEEIYT
jgi:hypothetical protein